MKIRENKTVPLSDILVGGSLRKRTEMNFRRMQDDIFGKGKAGLPPYCSQGWPGDWEGRSLLANVLDEEVLGKKSAVIDDLEDWIYFLMNDEGYRSEPDDKLNLDDINEQMHSAQNWLMRAFMEYYRITGNKKYLDTVKGILEKLYLPIIDHLPNYPSTAEDRATASDGAVIGHTQGHFKEWRLSSDIGCIFMCFDALGQAYGMITEEPLHSRIGKLIDAMLTEFKNVDYVGGHLQTHATLTCMRGIMRVYKIRKDPEILALIEKFFADYVRYGMTASYENINLFIDAGHTEPCGIIDSFMLARQLWEETDNKYYLDMSNKIFWNGVFRTQRENGGFGCDWTGRDGLLRPLKDFYEAYWCCSMRGAEGLGYPARNALYESDTTIALPLFFDFCARVKGAVLDVSSEYPILGKVGIRVSDGVDRAVTFRIYKPEHAVNFKITENGHEIPMTENNGFFEFTMNLVSGYEYEYTFDNVLATVPCAYNWHGETEETVHYGALILGTDTGFNEKIDLPQFKAIGGGRFLFGWHAFEPVFDNIHLTKNENIAKAYRIVFKK